MSKEYYDDPFDDGDVIDNEDERTPIVAKYNPENLPAISSEQLGYELEAFKPVDEQASDKETTISDLALINNHLAVHNHFLPHVRTIKSLCAMSITVTKLIEMRRKVKKLQVGQPAGKGSGGIWEVQD